MPHAPNQTIRNFRERVQWIVENLDPYPAYRRFLFDVNDVFVALEEAAKAGTFAMAKQNVVPTRRTWENALAKDSVSNIFLTWLYALYPDLSSDQMGSDTVELFQKLGEPIQNHRERWRPAIRYFAENRSQLAKIAKNYHASGDRSAALQFDDLEFPLLVRDGWVRNIPIELNENTERGTIDNPKPFKRFDQIRLPGLNSDYVAYKGSLAYSARRHVRTEPQHNGEIFCVDAIVSDASGFVGFKYFMARYFDYINTCEVLGAEIADWAIGHPSQLTPRSLELRGEPLDAFDLKKRATYPGVNCLAVFKRYSDEKMPEGDYFLLHKRDETQLQAQNSVHVVPAGGHQGFAKGGWRDDTALWRTMVREFAEELFNVEYLNRQPDTWEDFMKNKTVMKVADTFFHGDSPAARAHLHGFGLDPVTLRA